MYIHMYIYPFSTIILSFLVPRSDCLSLSLSLSFFLSRSLARKTKGLKIVTGNLVNTKDDNSVLEIHLSLLSAAVCYVSFNYHVITLQRSIRRYTY